MFLVQNENISFGRGVLFSLVAIALVFLILLIIIGCVYLMSLFKFKEKEEKPQVTNEVTKKLTIEDIKDEDMMVAALVATTMFVEETNEKDARLVSIKQIG